MACQCGCCDSPAPEGTEVPETEGTKDELQRQVEELDRRMKDLETTG